MATQKSTQAAPAASANISSETVLPSTAVLSIALGLLDEIAEQQDLVLSVAVAGGTCAEADSLLERNLFRVIQNMTEGTERIALLRSHIEALAHQVGRVAEVRS